jgi:hypothetical protein
VPYPYIPRLNNKRMKGGRKRNRQNNSSRAGSFRSNAGDIVVKRLTQPAQTLATGAGTVIPVTAVSSSQVQSAPATEWTSFAARYQQYRVRAIRIIGKATQPVQLAALAHGSLYRGDALGASTPSTSAQVLSDENVRENATYKDFVHVVTWQRNPNAKLWAPTGAAIPSQNTYSWVCASAVTPSLTTATTYYAYSVEWEVEFRGSQ